jgi:hypothetical protein
VQTDNKTKKIKQKITSNLVLISASLEKRKVAPAAARII